MDGLQGVYPAYTIGDMFPVLGTDDLLGSVARVVDEDIRKMTDGPQWTFLSNHGHVLLCIAEDQEARLRELAIRVGITERAVQRIITDLEEAGYLSRVREGRRNRYELHVDRHLRHPLVAHREVSALLDLIAGN
jgi:DNA-binding transcriptional ArsR family regulator